jgi:hypothetical protein
MADEAKKAWSDSSGKPVVWVIDADHWPRACLRAELMERGFEVIGFEGVSQALSALRHGLYERPFAMVIDLHGLDFHPKEREALTRIAALKILLGGTVELNEAWVKEADWTLVMRRPFAVGDVADAVEGLQR